MVNLAERGLVDALGRRREASLPALAEELAIPVSTAGNVMLRLIGKGLVDRREAESTGRGRPSYLYRIRLPRPVLALHFDGTQLAGGIVGEDLSVLAAHSVQIAGVASADAAALLAKEVFYSLVGQNKVPRQQLREAAVSVNAIYSKNRPVSSSVLPWAAEDLRQIFTRELGLETRIMAVPQALAEYQLLPEPKAASMLCLNVGDGISGHSIIAGQLAGGFSGRAGELGHLIVDPDGPKCGCGRQGCLEAYFGGPAIARRVQGEAKAGFAPAWVKQVQELSPRAVIERLYQAWCDGDPWSIQMMDQPLEKFAWALGVAVNLLDPALVICCGYVLQERPRWIEEMARRARYWILHFDQRGMSIVSGRAQMMDYLRVIASGFHVSLSSNAKETI